MKQPSCMLLDDHNKRSACYRKLRLRPKPTNVCWAYAMDLAYGVLLPGVLGVILAATCVAIVKNVDGAADFVQNHAYAEQVVSSLGTMLAFLVSLRLGANLARNSGVVGQFGTLCGACVNLAIWSRSLVTSGKLDIKHYADIDGGWYRTTEIGLILASIPYIVKYRYRYGPGGVKLEQLPIGADKELLARARVLTNPSDPKNAVAPFLAMVVLLGQIFDDLEHSRQITGPELGLVFNQLNALTGAEGAIGGIDGYGQPGVITVLMYLLFFLYFTLLTLGDIAINNSWQGLWIVAVLVVANFGLFQVSRRYANPFDVRRARSTQKPLITDATRGTEQAIDAIFARKRISEVMGTATAPAPGMPLRVASLSLGLK
jgi:hypothetical protein